MLSLLRALHKIAAPRGDGLHPELLRMLERPEAKMEPANEEKNQPEAVAVPGRMEPVEPIDSREEVTGT